MIIIFSTMKRFHLYIFLFIVAFVACEQDQPTRGTTVWKEDSTERLNIDIQGLPVLKLVNYRGGMILNGTFAKDHIRASVTRQVETLERDRLATMLEEIEFQVTSTSDTLFALVTTPPADRDEYYGCSLNMDIPYGMPVVVEYSNTIVIASELDSTVLVRNAQQKVLLSRHQGSAEIYAKGDIAMDVNLPRKGFIIAETDSGNIDLLLPASAHATILAESFYQPIRLINIELDTDVRRFHTASGVLGDGSGEVRLKTIYGRIRLKTE